MRAVQSWYGSSRFCAMRANVLGVRRRFEVSTVRRPQAEGFVGAIEMRDVPGDEV